MIEKTFSTRCGDIHFYVSGEAGPDALTLVFLPGLTADHRLFEKQLEYFEPLKKYNLLTWDAPGHYRPRPFSFDFDLMDKARWVDEILITENLALPVIVGQSMGGYVAQSYCQLFPDKMKGFISIDSAPLQLRFISGWELWMLKNVEPVYRWYPWKRMLKDGSCGCAVSGYGRQNMKEMMLSYDDDPGYYAKLAGHGFRMLAEAIEKDLPYEIKCPGLLVCGEKDMAGSAKAYNKKWAKATGLPIIWIKAAGHNANADQPELINTIIEDFIREKVTGADGDAEA